MNPPRIHDLKTWPEFFQAIVSGEKTAEFRRDDRGFKVGDILRLEDWEPGFQSYTGSFIRKRITHITPAVLGIPAGFVMLSLGEP